MSWVKNLKAFKYANTSLSTWPRNLVDDICKHNILIVAFDTNLFPLNVLSKANVIAKEWMRHAAKYRRFGSQINSQMIIKFSPLDVRSFSVLEENACSDLLPHSVSSSLIKHFTILVALKWMVQVLRWVLSLITQLTLHRWKIFFKSCEVSNRNLGAEGQSVHIGLMLLAWSLIGRVRRYCRRFHTT